MQLLHVGTLAAFLGAAAIQPASALGQLSVPEVVRQMVVELYPWTGQRQKQNRVLNAALLVAPTLALA